MIPPAAESGDVFGACDSGGFADESLYRRAFFELIVPMPSGARIPATKLPNSFSVTHQTSTLMPNPLKPTRSTPGLAGDRPAVSVPPENAQSDFATATSDPDSSRPRCNRIVNTRAFSIGRAGANEPRHKLIHVGFADRFQRDFRGGLIADIRTASSTIRPY
jgi:hypothetical protein